MKLVTTIGCPPAVRCEHCCMSVRALDHVVIRVSNWARSSASTAMS
jgi:hypothetical protein